jgi:hypothetical protein
MVFPKLKSLVSADLAATALPNDPDNFSISFQAVIGTAESDGGDIFSFTAVSAGFLAIERRTIWGRGLLVVPEFSWPTVQSAVERLLTQSARSTWPEAAAEINKVLCWEFDNYQRANA